MAHEYSDINEIIEQDMMYGYFDVVCDGCGEDYRIEPDAAFDCHECGTLVMSPLVEEGLY